MSASAGAQRRALAAAEQEASEFWISTSDLPSGGRFAGRAETTSSTTAFITAGGSKHLSVNSTVCALVNGATNAGLHTKPLR